MFLLAHSINYDHAMCRDWKWHEIRLVSKDLAHCVKHSWIGWVPPGVAEDVFDAFSQSAQSLEQLGPEFSSMADTTLIVPSSLGSKDIRGKRRKSPFITVAKQLASTTRYYLEGKNVVRNPVDFRSKYSAPPFLLHCNTEMTRAPLYRRKYEFSENGHGKKSPLDFHSIL